MKKGKKGTLVADFKEFINKRGNVLDLAVAVVIGAAFGKIISSLVEAIIMPLLSLVMGGTHFGDWKWVLKAATATAEEIAIGYGMFIQAVIDFLIIALCIFFFVRIVVRAQNRIKKAYTMRKGEVEAVAAVPVAEPAAPIEPSKPTQEELLMEIRDLLKAQANKKTN